eukprot:TRINITY_DN19959_c0_g1_i1.p1 TRINITY_DN19959_c0_g1~~TRINITY_DN19959_c0_g1_i1.p1  ORF type:complete len:274 (-),score=14.35 TRINITY_DN19959_c0_g1_i1:291-1112(-)
MSSEKKLVCTRCGKTFGSASLLREHPCNLGVSVVSESWMQYNLSNMRLSSSQSSSTTAADGKLMRTKSTMVRASWSLRDAMSSSSSRTRSTSRSGGGSSSSQAMRGETSSSSSSSTRRSGTKQKHRESSTSGGTGAKRWEGSESARLSRQSTIAVPERHARAGGSNKSEKGKREFECRRCGKGFSRSDTLRRHEQMVHGDSLVRCSNALCEQTFGSEEAARRHEREVHGNRSRAQWRCDVCGASFRGQAQLTQHRRNAHPSLNTHSLYSLDRT